MIISRRVSNAWSRSVQFASQLSASSQDPFPWRICVWACDDHRIYQHSPRQTPLNTSIPQPNTIGRSIESDNALIPFTPCGTRLADSSTQDTSTVVRIASAGPGFSADHNIIGWEVTELIVSHISTHKPPPCALELEKKSICCSSQVKNNNNPWQRLGAMFRYLHLASTVFSVERIEQAVHQPRPRQSSREIIMRGTIDANKRA